MTVHSAIRDKLCWIFKVSATALMLCDTFKSVNQAFKSLTQPTDLDLNLLLSHTGLV